MSDEAISLRPNPRVVRTKLDDGTAILLHLESKYYFTLNSTGSFVWDLLEQQPMSPAAIVEAIVGEFEVTAEAAAADLDALVRNLGKERLILMDTHSA